MKHELYREVLLDHYRNPRKNALLANATHEADTANQSCGDRARVTLVARDGQVEDVGIVVDGCALAVAGGSVLAESVMGSSIADVRKIDVAEILALLGNVAPSPTRVRCATLALEALRSAISEH